MSITIKELIEKEFHPNDKEAIVSAVVYNIDDKLRDIKEKIDKAKEDGDKTLIGWDLQKIELLKKLKKEYNAISAMEDYFEYYDFDSVENVINFEPASDLDFIDWIIESRQ